MKHILTALFASACVVLLSLIEPSMRTLFKIPQAMEKFPIWMTAIPFFFIFLLIHAVFLVLLQIIKRATQSILIVRCFIVAFSLLVALVSAVAISDREIDKGFYEPLFAAGLFIALPFCVAELLNVKRFLAKV